MTNLKVLKSLSEGAAHLLTFETALHGLPKRGRKEADEFLRDAKAALGDAWREVFAGDRPVRGLKREVLGNKLMTLCDRFQDLGQEIFFEPPMKAHRKELRVLLDVAWDACGEAGELENERRRGKRRKMEVLDENGLPPVRKLRDLIEEYGDFPKGGES